MARNQTFSKWTPTSPFVFHHFSAKTYQILAKCVTKVTGHDIPLACASLLTVAEEISLWPLQKQVLENKKRWPARSSVGEYIENDGQRGQAPGPTKVTMAVHQRAKRHGVLKESPPWASLYSLNAKCGPKPMLEGPLNRPRAEAQTTPAPPLSIFLPRGFFKSSKRRKIHPRAKKMDKGGAGAQKCF